MSMIDEWGEEIDSIQDEGVFSRSALGDVDTPAPTGAAMNQGFPNTMPPTFPYAPTPQKVIQQVGPNKYGLYQGPPAAPGTVRAAFPERPIYPAGMGDINDDIYNDIIATQSGGSSSGFDYDFGYDQPSGGYPAPAAQPAAQPNWMQGLQAGFMSLNAIGSAVGQGFDIAGRYQAGQMQMEQASAMFEAQMDMMTMRMEEARANGEMDRYMELLQLQSALENAASTAQSSGSSADIATLMQLLQQSQSMTGSRISPVIWVVGGVVVLGLGGLLVWALTRDDKK